MACVVGHPVEESFIALVTKAGECRRAATSIAKFDIRILDIRYTSPGLVRILVSHSFSTGLNTCVF